MINKANQSNNNVGNDLVGRDKVTNHYYNLPKDSQYLNSKLPTYLGKVVFQLEKCICTTEEYEYPEKTKYKIEKKIKFNHISKYYDIINDWGIYGSIVDSIYNTLDDEKPNSKTKFLLNINRMYKATLGEFKNELNTSDKYKVIESCSDKIMDSIYLQLRNDLLSSNLTDTIHQEDIDLCVTIIICKAFVDCKILEVPV